MNEPQPIDLYAFYRRMFGSDAREDLVSAFVEHSHVKTYDKGEVIFSPTQGGTSSFFLLNGVMKICVLSPDGTENTLGYFFQPGTGYAMNEETIKATELWCKTVTPCVLVELSPGLFDLAEEYQELWKKLVLGWRPFYFGMMDKLRAGYTLSAKERYLWFAEKYGPIVDIIPQNEIASYLGIQPQSLSRIRNELAEGGHSHDD